MGRLPLVVPVGDGSSTLATRTTPTRTAGIEPNLCARRKNFIRLLTTYLDGNFGLDNNLRRFWSQATAVAQKKASIAGSVAVVFLEHDATATIKAGARINQDPASRARGDQDVVVTR